MEKIIYIDLTYSFLNKYRHLASLDAKCLYLSMKFLTHIHIDSTSILNLNGCQYVSFGYRCKAL
jgi:hypothetical protein